MNQIEIDDLNKHYGAYHALRDINLKIPAGSFVALIGPSGCGKSTLLRTIAGLEKFTGGTLRIAGEVMNTRPPRERDVAMVFQSYALYPHMDVERNMTYSLRLKRRPREEILERAKSAANTLGLTALLSRKPRELSGGQRQRVAMGRAIVRNPKVFLFDEPLSNLDAELRVRMRGEIRRLHERLGATSVYVTHDQIEAMTMADYVVVLRAGRIEQQGAPLDLYDRPANRFVAGFIGSPSMNFLPARVAEDGRTAILGEADGQRIDLGREVEPGREILVGMRPEHLQIRPASDATGLQATVELLESTGSMTFMEARLAGAPITVSQAGRMAAARGEPVRLQIDPENLRLFDPATEAAI
ncbi:carbohydrate ABC transporter ATP-binding protein, CUT1 family [Faunimonas pinastri]|uniref:Carbohydrate ABC transporter ATP-binding protein, CUT1 family n=1 Tax=Faunimonas pinastri TaxID=1855383 RepID=A0A1H9IE85_9HYPH|nr:sn-glycerol-3-phosphate ABC transporter ATP-binding protein UgpC [Faunimonas pinastri]SEQ72857.1 carbohydrate ABC transporter ATP-binding protein, CUT1 family [Faunimonas pinastri]